MKTILIENFKLNVFRNLLDQSLITSKELMFEVSPDMIRSCSFSSTKSLMKLWTIPLQTLVQLEDDNIESLDEQPELNLEFETFNFYVLRGDLFKKYLSVYNSDVVNIEFDIEEINGKYHGTVVRISGQTESKYALQTTFTLTKEKLLSNKIDDYSAIIRECTPDKGMFEFLLPVDEVKEIKRLIKNLHQSVADNTSYLTFIVDIENKKIIVSDKVFKIDFELKLDLCKNIESLEHNLHFNILKTDFIMVGNHTFNIYTSPIAEKVIIGTKFAGSIIWGLSSKVDSSSSNSFSNSIEEASMENIDFDVAEYLGD